MVAIGSFTKNPQAEVDLTIGENDHDFKLNGFVEMFQLLVGRNNLKMRLTDQCCSTLRNYRFFLRLLISSRMAMARM